MVAGHPTAIAPTASHVAASRGAIPPVGTIRLSGETASRLPRRRGRRRGPGTVWRCRGGRRLYLPDGHPALSKGDRVGDLRSDLGSWAGATMKSAPASRARLAWSASSTVPSPMRRPGCWRRDCSGRAPVQCRGGSFHHVSPGPDTARCRGDRGLGCSGSGRRSIRARRSAWRSIDCRAGLISMIVAACRRRRSAPAHRWKCRGRRRRGPGRHSGPHGPTAARAADPARVAVPRGNPPRSRRLRRPARQPRPARGLLMDVTAEEGDGVPRAVLDDQFGGLGQQPSNVVVRRRAPDGCRLVQADEHDGRTVRQSMQHRSGLFGGHSAAGS